DVHVGAVVQLLTSQLAEPDHHERVWRARALALEGYGAVVRRHGAPPPEVCRGETPIRQRAHLAHGVVHCEAASQIAQADPQILALSVAAQRGGELRPG